MLRDLYKEWIKETEEAYARIIITDEYEFPVPFRPYSEDEIENQFSRIVLDSISHLDGVVVIGFDQFQKEERIHNSFQWLLRKMISVKRDDFLVAISVPVENLNYVKIELERNRRKEIDLIEAEKDLNIDDGFLLRIIDYRDGKGDYIKLYPNGLLRLLRFGEYGTVNKRECIISEKLCSMVKGLAKRYMKHYFIVDPSERGFERNHHFGLGLEFGREYLGIHTDECPNEWIEYLDSITKYSEIRILCQHEMIKDFIYDEEKVRKAEHYRELVYETIRYSM